MVSPEVPATRPEWLPENYWDAEKKAPIFDQFGKHYTEVTARDQAAQDALKNFPATIDNYQITPSEELKYPDGLVDMEGKPIPAGTPIKLNQDDPLYRQVREWAFQNKVDPKIVSDLASSYAKDMLAVQKNFATRRTEELGKLGANAPARLDAMFAGMAAHGVPERAINAFKAVPISADLVGMIEHYQQKLTSQGAASTPASPHQTPTPPEKSVAETMYAATTPKQRAS